MIGPGTRQAVMLPRPLGAGKFQTLLAWESDGLVDYQPTEVGPLRFLLVWKEDACEEPLWQSFLRLMR